MATDPRKRQKKLEKRASKRKEKKHVVTREQSAGLPGRLAEASQYPVLHCWTTDRVDSNGIGWVVLSREVPGGRVAVASFLVDRYCLGVKNVHGEILPRLDYESKYVRKIQKDMQGRPIPPAEARKYIEGAVAYARGLGLSPHPDYPRVMPLFGDIDPAASDATFEFGKDGKPFYISGPNDTTERSRQIVATLRNTCGPDGFHYMVAISPEEFGELTGQQEEMDELEGE